MGYVKKYGLFNWLVVVYVFVKRIKNDVCKIFVVFLCSYIGKDFNLNKFLS